MQRRWIVAALGTLLVGALIFGGCGLTRWAIHKWGEPQYMSYRIDARNLSVYAYPRQRFAYTKEGIDAALSLAGDRAAAARRGLVIFLHGRGKHPEKAYGDDREIGRDILGQMTAHYGVEVLLLHWPSWLDVAGYPSLNAKEAGPHLDLFFERLGRYRLTRDENGARPVTLFVHSMGNQVLASYIDTLVGASQDSGPIHWKGPLFDTLILNAPDVDLTDHRLWVERIGLAERIFVLVNSGKDPMLKMSTYLLETPRLGRQLIHSDGRREPLASNADYVDLVELGVKHDYFYGEALPPELVEFYRRALRRSADPLDTQGMRAGDRDRLHVLHPSN
jgi:esterase/lipase superfamily enzyme